MDENQKLADAADKAATEMAENQILQAGLSSGPVAELLHSVARNIMENDSFATQAVGLLALLVEKGVFEYPSCAVTFTAEELLLEETQQKVYENLKTMTEFIRDGVETVTGWADEDEKKGIAMDAGRVHYLLNVLYQIVIGVVTVSFQDAQAYGAGEPAQGIPQA